MLKTFWSSARTPFLGLWVVFFASACGTSRPTPEAPKPAPVSQSDEIEMGDAVDSNLTASRRFYNDSALEAYVQQLGMRLVAQCDRKDLPWTFRILDEPSINAFAFPGGFVYVTRGMLAYINSEAQLAAVLGHEIGHVVAGHVVDRSTRLGITGGGLVVGRVGGAMTPVYGSLDRLQALLLANSRQAEQQADEMGLRLMSDAGYDPMEMLAVLRTIERAAGGPAWLATHPSPEHRIEGLMLERSLFRDRGTLVERDTYLAHVEGLVFGLDRRQGYVLGRHLVVPERGYQFTFPDGWTLSRDGPAVRAISPGQDATIELTTVDQPDVDSATRYFFSKIAKSRVAPVRSQVNGITMVSGAFSALPLSIKVGGSVRLIELRGRVYRLLGYTRDDWWPAYRDMVDSTLQTFELVPDSAMRAAQPAHVAIVSLRKPMSLAALGKARPAPVTPADLAGINQVPVDSVLPAGQAVKWVVGPSLQ